MPAFLVKKYTGESWRPSLPLTVSSESEVEDFVKNHWGISQHILKIVPQDTKLWRVMFMIWKISWWCILSSNCLKLSLKYLCFKIRNIQGKWNYKQVCLSDCMLIFPRMGPKLPNSLLHWTIFCLNSMVKYSQIPKVSLQLGFSKDKYTRRRIPSNRPFCGNKFCNWFYFGTNGS